MITSYAVEVEDLVKTFGSFVAVDHITFKVEKGEIFGFLGPNGAGKSTTIRILCGLLMPTSGKGTVAGFDVIEEPEKIKRAIGYMSQKFSLYEDLKVVENIHFFGGIYGLSGSLLKEREEEALRVAGLGDLRDRMTRTLAVGWKQRLALGCAILHQPSILFLDEPTSGVDPISRRNFWSLIQQMSEKGVTTFVTTHYMDEAEYCDRLALIYKGKIIALGTPSELKVETLSRGVKEVDCDPLIPALDLIKKEGWVSEAAVFGDTLHVIGKEGTDLEKEVRSLFERHEILLRRMDSIRPSLEDVFVALIEREGQR
ncbi:MAG: multidrug ABC transporter ATP-binding protein [Deltaproteobacteria bacterium RBG_13_52_11b]|nr:MAG: multidrug ABC transporter ATP-binding protein [Deltaproteobacteria bacterium RBG_13_52_11b]